MLLYIKDVFTKVYIAYSSILQDSIVLDKLNESYLGHRTLLCDAADWHQYDQDGWCCTKLLLLFSIWQQPAPPQCWLGTAGTSGGTDSLWKASWRRLWGKTECKHEVNYISNTKPVTELVTLKVLTSDEWRLHIFKWSNNKQRILSCIVGNGIWGWTIIGPKTQEISTLSARFVLCSPTLYLSTKLNKPTHYSLTIYIN